MTTLGPVPEPLVQALIRYYECRHATEIAWELYERELHEHLARRLAKAGVAIDG